MLNHESYAKLKETAGANLGYILLRDLALSQVIGQGNEDISYWLGKEMARQIPLESIESLVQLFADCGLGELSLTQEKRVAYKFELSGQAVQARLQLDPESSFLLEAGLISQEVEGIRQRLTEATVETFAGKQKVVFTVQTDIHDIAEPMEAEDTPRFNI